MRIYYGNQFDTTNFATDKYLQINSCSYQNSSPMYTVIREEGRLDYHILLINSGVCEALHKERLHTLTAGNLIIYAPGEEQRYTFKSESSSLWCHFGGKIVEELFNSCGIKSGVYNLSPNKEIFECYSRVIQRFHQPGREKFANPALLELIYCISDALENPVRNNKGDVILPILTYININYNKKLSLDALAKMSGYSKSRFSHIFSEVTGTTPTKYQNGIRLKVSCEMLSSTDYSINDIAFECGFSDPLYYSRIFRKKYNVSPTEYRLSAKNG